MTSIQRLAILGLSLFSTLAIAQETAPSNPPPVTPDTTTSNLQESTAPVPMTKGEMKAQRRQQKQQEKSANANADAEKHRAKARKNEAKATKDEAKALKDDHKSTNAAEKANTPQ